MGPPLWRAKSVVFFVIGAVSILSIGCGASLDEKQYYRGLVMEMFDHAYQSYMLYAYPADELMPLSCKGRVRGQERSRGPVDEALGRFSLTLIDTLDTLAVMGDVEEFNSAIWKVITSVNFDSDVIVSVFETNIRVLGGLLGGHFSAIALKEKGHEQLYWYDNQLLLMADEIGRRLLPAFNTTTGLPYPKVNLRHGMDHPSAKEESSTCTACAGTLMLEFAALSRLTGNPEYELKAWKAMEAIWERRHSTHNLVGTVIDVHNGNWLRKDSGVGAGIDSYYEYCLKSYILLGYEDYLQRFEKHYSAVMTYVSNGPMLMNVNMNSPYRISSNFMDALLAFWPGLQVLWGDLDAAIDTHNMLYQVIQKHNFLPEAFTADMKVHWPNHLLRPEFIESTYFLYKATRDPFYLDVGKTVIESMNKHARVACGFAALKDVRTNTHEDRMDSFVLAETLKYLYLLFTEEEDLVLDMDVFIFSTEAHLFPLSLALINSTSPSRRRQQKEEEEEEVSEGTDQKSTTCASGGSDGINADKEGSCASTSDGHLESNDKEGIELVRVVAPSLLHCPNIKGLLTRVYYAEQYKALMLQRCSATARYHRSRSEGFPSSQQQSATTTNNNAGTDSNKKRPPSITNITLNNLDLTDSQQRAVLATMGIVITSMPDGRMQLSHVSKEALSPELAEEGWYLMQDIMKAMAATQNSDGTSKRDMKVVRVLLPESEQRDIKVGPALFGPDLGGDTQFQVGGNLVYAEPFDGCSVFLDSHLVNGNIVLVDRGHCMFIVKVRNAESAGAAGVIVADHLPIANTTFPFAMSGDDSTANSVGIPSVFMHHGDSRDLLQLMNAGEEMYVLLTWSREQQKGSGEGEGEGEREEERETEEGKEGEGEEKREMEGEEERKEEGNTEGEEKRTLADGNPDFTAHSEPEMFQEPESAQGTTSSAESMLEQHSDSAESSGGADKTNSR